jgi:hypothetical protein
MLVSFIAGLGASVAITWQAARRDSGADGACVDVVARRDADRTATCGAGCRRCWP